MKKFFSKKRNVGERTKSKENVTNEKRSNPLHSVGMKLFLYFFVSIVAFVSIVGYLAYQTSKDIIGEKVASASHQTIIMAREKLDMIYKKYDEVTMSYVVDSDFQTMLRDFNGMSEENAYESLQLNNKIRNRLQQRVFTDSNLVSLELYNLDGSQYLNQSDTALSEVDWFQNILEENGAAVWIEPNENLTANSFAVGRLIKDTVTSQASVVLVMEIKMSTLSDQLVNIDMGETDNQLIISEEGIIIHSFDESKIGEMSNIDFTSGQQNNINSDQYIGENEEGVEELIVFDQSPKNSRWYVVGTVHLEELTRDTKQIYNITLLVALIAAALAIVIGFMLARIFGRPLVNLRNLMQRGEQGDLSVRTNIKSKDEIGQLGTSFNRMMEQIAMLVQHTNQSAQEVLRTAAELSDVSKKTAMSAKEISVATEQIAGGASTLALEAERGNELTSNIRVEMDSVVDSNFEMGKSANEVRKVSEQGIVYMSQLIEKTNSTEKMTRSMTDKVDNLRESTTSIRQILDVLNSMTKQTNILSLNATIEAARAGAAGKGFMVVADEIRKLADQSKQSIEVVGQITEGIQNEIDETVAVLSEAYPMFKEQTDSVREADLIFKNVQGQMDEFIQHLDAVTNSIQQLEGSQATLSEAMSSVSSVSQESSATSEEVASLSSEQLNVSEGLVELSQTLEALSKSLDESLSKFNT
jgi:methyl-accepting chemotaxis protein